jgi:hypothetical protein
MVNDYIYKVCSRHVGAEVVDVNQIGREGFTAHGLHMSRRGKRRWSRMILAAVRTLDKVKQPPSKPPTTPSSKLRTMNNLDNLNIQVVETHMSTVIQQYVNDKSVGFAHSISADFQDPRHMTAGVAVVFKHNFGKPTRSQCLTSHLALQRERYSASVYSLITKGRCFEKPDILNYNAAFKHLTTDFKSKGLTHLICPPIGCVRDKVNLPVFINNLKRFQQATKAKVTIVSYHQESSRHLKNGLSSDDFNRRLNELIKPSHDTRMPSEASHKALTTVTHSSSSPTEPFTLPHDSYAAAVSHRPTSLQEQLPSASASPLLTSTQISPKTISSDVSDQFHFSKNLSVVSLLKAA